MARRQHNQSISLFPFLAVLVCTMGSLILLLLVTTRQIRHDQQEARQSPSPAVPPTAVVAPAPVAPQLPAEPAVPDVDYAARLSDLQQQLDSASSTLTELDQQLAQLTAEQAQADRELQELHAAAAAAATQLQTLQSATTAATRPDLVQQTRELQVQQQRLKTQLDAAAAALAAKQQELVSRHSRAQAATGQLHESRSALLALRQQVELRQTESTATSGRKTIVEFTNTTGTTRTPILIDVSDAGYEFLPTGVRITARDMQGFPVRDNPLLSGILTLHQHRSGRSVTAQPYVLLLVRPDGCLPFYGAQRVLSEAGIHFGYELLDAERVIAAGTRDQQEVEVVRQALLESLNRREVLYAMLRRSAEAAPGEALPGEPPERRLVVRSDGRVLLGENSERRPLEGRYYAGGEAPPRTLYKPQPAGGARGPLPLFAENSGGPGQAGKNTGNVGEQSPGSSAQPSAAARGSSADLAMTGRSGTGGATGHAGQPQVSSQSDNADSAESFLSAESRSAGSPAMSGGGATAADAAGSPLAAQQAFDRALADRDIPPATAATAAAAPPSRTAPGTAAKTATTPEESLLASANQGTPDGQHSDSASLGASGTTSAATGWPAPAADNSESSGKPVDLTRIDPELLRLLKARQSEQREHSTPVGITVFLDAQHLTIGQQPTVPVHPDTLDYAFARLLQGISDEVAAARRDPQEPLLPIVKFVVSPGGERLRIPLARELRAIGIPSASVVEVTPYIVPADDAGHATIEDTTEPPQTSTMRPVSAQSFQGGAE